MADPTRDDALRLREKFYAAAFDDTMWSDAMDDLGGLLRASIKSLGYLDFQTGAQTMLVGDCDQHYAELFVALGSQNPYLDWMRRQLPGTVLREDDFVDRAEFERGVFFNEWMLPQQTASSLFSKVFAASSTAAQLAFNRPVGAPVFDDHDVAFFRLVAPAIEQAAELRFRAGTLSLRRQSGTLDRLSLGLIAVDGQCRVLHHNERAAAFLDGGEGLRLIRGRIAAWNPIEQARLAASIADAVQGTGQLAGGRGGDLTISCPVTGQAAFALSVRPIPDAAAQGLDAARAAIIVVQRIEIGVPPGFEVRMRNLFGFTEKEAALAAALAGGLSLREAAEQRGIGMATARTQLLQLFRKTDTAQQSQLVALLLGILPVAD